MSKIINDHKCLEIPNSMKDIIKIIKTVTENKWVLAKHDERGLCETVFYKIKFCPYCGGKLE